jgi:hypothetical protein
MLPNSEYLGWPRWLEFSAQVRSGRCILFCSICGLAFFPQIREETDGLSCLTVPSIIQCELIVSASEYNSLYMRICWGVKFIDDMIVEFQISPISIYFPSYLLLSPCLSHVLGNFVSRSRSPPGTPTLWGLAGPDWGGGDYQKYYQKYMDSYGSGGGGGYEKYMSEPCLKRPCYT